MKYRCAAAVLLGAYALQAGAMPDDRWYHGERDALGPAWVTGTDYGPRTVAPPTTDTFAGQVGDGSLAGSTSTTAPPTTVWGADAFVVSQIPEPSTWALLLAGLSLIGLVRWRRTRR